MGKADAKQKAAQEKAALGDGKEATQKATQEKAALGDDKKER